MKRSLCLLATAGLLAAGGTWYAAQGAPAPAEPTESATIDGVLDLVAAGRLDAATQTLQALRGDPHAAAVRRLIDERAAFARQLVVQAGAANTGADPQAAGRALAFAIEIDRGLDITKAADELDARTAQAEAAIGRAATCAAQRQFGCVRDAVEAARAADHHHPGAMFWSLYLGDWRPMP